MTGSLARGRTAMPARSRRAGAIVLVLSILAAGSAGVTVATARNYLEATLAASAFHVCVEGVVRDRTDGQDVARVDAVFANGSRWPLSVISMRAVIHLDGSYLWGQNFDWLSAPVELAPGETRRVTPEIALPGTKADILAQGATAWTVRVSGLVDMPRLGTKQYRTETTFAHEEVSR